MELILARERRTPGPDRLDPRSMQIPSPDGHELRMEYASTASYYTFISDRVAVTGTRSDQGTWRMADRFVLIDCDSGGWERIDWLELQKNLGPDFVLRRMVAQ